MTMPPTFLLLVWLALVLFVEAFPSHKNGVDWAQWGRNAQFTSYANVSLKTAGLHGRDQWNFTAGDRVVGSAAVGHGRVCFGSDDGHFRCLDQHTGSVMWQFFVPEGSESCSANFCEHGLCPCNKIRSDPAMAPDGSVIFGSYDHNLYKLDFDGKLVWKVPTGGGIYGPVTLDQDGTSFVGSFDSKLYAIDKDGNVKWATDIGAHGDSGWALGAAGTPHEHLVFGQSNEGGYCTQWPPPDVPNPPNRSAGGGYCYVYAIDKNTGEVVWKVWTGTPGGGGMYAQGMFITGSWNDYVLAYEAATGKVLWYFNAGGSIESHPALSVDQKTVFISTEDPSKTLYALEIQTGKVVWSYSGAAEELNGSPSVTADMVFVGSNDHFLHAVDVDTGKLRFKFKTCANVFSSAAIDVQGMVYVGCNTVTGTSAGPGVGAMYAINPQKNI